MLRAHLEWRATHSGNLSKPQRGVRLREKPRLAGRTRRNKMARYLISFDDGTMIIPEEEMPEVGAASHRVVDEAKAAGVWIFGGGVLSQRASIVATDGTVADGPYPETKAVIGGFSIVDVPSREEALEWAAKLAAACPIGPAGPARLGARQGSAGQATTGQSEPPQSSHPRGPRLLARGQNVYT